MNGQERNGYLRAVMSVGAFLESWRGTAPSYTKEYTLFEQLIRGLGDVDDEQA